MNLELLNHEINEHLLLVEKELNEIRALLNRPFCFTIYAVRTEEKSLVAFQDRFLNHPIVLFNSHGIEKQPEESHFIAAITKAINRIPITEIGKEIHFVGNYPFDNLPSGFVALRDSMVYLLVEIEKSPEEIFIKCSERD